MLHTSAPDIAPLVEHLFRAGSGRLLAALVAATASFAFIPARAQTPTLLVPGMELQYESNGVAGAPWRVDLVERNVSLGARTGCLRVRFAPGGPRPAADERVTCEADGMLFAWDTAGRAWRASRPIAPDRTLDQPTRTGVAKYSTLRASDEEISGVTVRVIETTVLTIDSTGRAVRRLRERYAPALGTATWGAFETPDSAAAGGWRVQQEFRLVAIRRPGG